MQVKSDDGQLLSLIREAKSLALITDSQADADTVSAMLAFYHLFNSETLKIVLVVPEAVPPECQRLPESSVIRNDLGPKDLVINLDTRGSPLDKIAYSQEGPVFSLVIHPKERAFEIERIRYSYEGSQFDAFILCSVLKLSDLGDLYTKNQKEFSQTTIVDLDFRRRNERYGSLNIIDDSSSGLSEALFKKLMVWSIVPSQNCAAALLTGLASKSNELAPKEGTILRSEVLEPKTKEELIASGGEALIQ